MKVVCPFCGRTFVRHPRALLANKFCNKCIEERVNYEGQSDSSREYIVTIDDDGYSQLEPAEYAS
jgi:hypothetical protein